MKVAGRRRILALATVLFSVLLVLAVVEIGLRLFYPFYTVGIERAYEYDPKSNYRLKPGIHLLQTTDFQEEVRTNHLGIVGFQEDFSDYASLVFCLGDSFTHGVGVPVDASYPFQLDLTLNTDPQGLYAKSYGVVNLGVAGYGGEQSLLALRHYAAQIRKPDFILYLGVENDYEDDAIFRSGQQRRHLVDGSPYWGRLLLPARWFFHLEIGKRVKLAGGELWRDRALQAALGPAARPWRSKAEREEPVLEKILAASREYNAVLIVGWIPTPVPSASAPSYQWLKSWAARKGVAFADWMPAVDAVRSAMPALPVDNPHSGDHWRGWVNRLIAEEFARHFRNRGR